MAGRLQPGARPQRRRLLLVFPKRPEESRAQTRQQRSSAAVFAVSAVHPARDVAHIILTVRAEALRHGGQVSLPGGVVDPGETFEQAALREAHEEVGAGARRRCACSAR